MARVVGVQCPGDVQVGHAGEVGFVLIDIDAEFAVARKQLGFVLVNTGDVAAAAAAFRAFLELVPADSPDAALIRDVLSAIEQQG